MKACEILVMEDFEQIVAGRLYVQDDELAADSKEDYEILMENLLDEFDEEDPEKVLEKLPEKFSGLALRARIVEDASEDWDPSKREVAKDSEAQWRGLPLTIETEAGETRSGKDSNGKPWSVKMTHDYGELRGTKGVDGDPVDVFLGPDKDSEFVYVVHVLKSPHFQEFDEDKCFLDFPSEASARKAFFDNYTQPEFFGSLERFPVERFIEKVKSTAKKAKPISVVVDSAKDGVKTPWIGVDLDNTLALTLEGDYEPLKIGPPNPDIVEKVRQALQNGRTVRVFTARLSAEEPLRTRIRKAITDWTLEHVGQKLDSTNEKDFALEEIWDDKAKPIA